MFLLFEKNYIFYVTLDIEKFVDINVFQHLLFIIDILTEKKVKCNDFESSFLSTFVCFRFTIYSHFWLKSGQKKTKMTNLVIQGSSLMS